MSSPVEFDFSSFIKIDRSKEDSVYLQIVYQCINAVKRKILTEGEQLPGSRKIAEQLKLHRKTVVAALAELQAQGWVEAVPNRGTFVRNPEKTEQKSGNIKLSQQPPENAVFSFRRDQILEQPAEENNCRLLFTAGSPDYRWLDVEELLRFYTSVVRRTKNPTDHQYSLEGNLFFREQLSYYLNLSRGFHISRDFLLPLSGQEQVFSVLARLLIRTGDVILVEELSYFLPNMIFSQAGARLQTLPMDQDGMDVGFIRNNYKAGEIRAVYVRPRSQYPTTCTLSEKRRSDLLRLAEEMDFIIIEDDFDFESCSRKSKTDSLFRKNNGNRVIYLGAFGSFLHPGFQLNFILGPKDFLEEGKKYLGIFGRPDIMLEKALGEMIYQGDIFRYQRKAQKLINERKEKFTELLQLSFKNEIETSLPTAGLAIWVRFKARLSLVQLKEKLKSKGVFLPGICLYQNQKIIALRLGFAHFQPEEMEEALTKLHQAYVQTLDSQKMNSVSQGVPHPKLQKG